MVEELAAMAVPSEVAVTEGSKNRVVGHIEYMELMAMCRHMR